MYFSTGIKELDRMIGSGIKTNYCYAIKGTAGAGKTVLSMHIALGALKQNIPVVFITTEVETQKIKDYFASFDINVEQFEERALLDIVKMKLEVKGGVTIQTDKFDLSGIILRTKARVEAIGAKLVIFDSISSFIAEFVYRDIARSKFIEFIQEITEMDTALILTVESKQKDTKPDLEDFLVDGVIQISTEMRDYQIVKNISVPKLRASKPSTYKNRLIIDENGVKIFRSEQQPIIKIEGQKTGLKKLDELIGGFPKGTVVLIEISDEINYYPLFLTLLYNKLREKAGIIIHSNVQMCAERVLEEFERRSIDISEQINEGDVIFIDKYNRSVTTVEAQEIYKTFTIEDMLSITMEMMYAFDQDQNKISVIFNDLTDDMNILEEKEFLRFFSLQSYNIKNENALSYSFINYKAVKKEVLSRLRTNADIILRLTKVNYNNYLEGLKSSSGATFLPKLVKFNDKLPLIEIIE